MIIVKDCYQTMIYLCMCLNFLWSMLPLESKSFNERLRTPDKLLKKDTI